MQVFWITFVESPLATPLNLGAGVTANDEGDARALAYAAFGPRPLQRIEPVQDINDLEGRHVRPNMGDVFKRGVWFPLGYETAT